MSDQKPTRSELKAALLQTEAELAAARADSKASPFIEARTAIIVALITGSLGFGQAILNRAEPVVDDCVAQRADAIALVLKTGVWVPLPDDESEVEKQCDINEYVVEWQEQNPDYEPPEQTTAPDPSPSPSPTP